MAKLRKVECRTKDFNLFYAEMMALARFHLSVGSLSSFGQANSSL